MKKCFEINGVALKFAYSEFDGESFTQLCLDFQPDSRFVYTGISRNFHIPILKIFDEIRSEFYNIKNVTFIYFITSEPKTVEQCCAQLAYQVLGMPTVQWFHRYSDLTGYLWTDISIYNGAHDIHKEIETSVNQLYKQNKSAYLSLQIKQN